MGAPPRLQKYPLPRAPSTETPPLPLPPPPPPPPPPKPTRRKPRSPLTSPLPSLRLLLHPRPGLGIDMRLPLSQRTRCYMQLESLFNGPSTIRIGLHPPNFPGARLQLSPTPNLSVRIPLRINGAKYLHLGLVAHTRWGLDTQWRRWKWGHDVWDGLSKFGSGWGVATFVEIWRYTTAGAMVDRRVKQGLKDAMLKRKVAGGLDGGGLDSVPIDPREKDDLVEVLKNVLAERRRHRVMTGPDAGFHRGEGGGRGKR